jgi:uncharacterized protein YdhG (YjbR/CyaY superfamily)
VAEQLATIDEYISGFPAEVRPVLEEVRRRIRAAIPQAGETISYGMPAFTLGGKDVVYFAGWKSHLAVYPVPEGGTVLAAEMAPYLAAKGTLKFPLPQAHPVRPHRAGGHRSGRAAGELSPPVRCSPSPSR